jgi:hypothetical protein
MMIVNIKTIYRIFRSLVFLISVTSCNIQEKDIKDQGEIICIDIDQYVSSNDSIKFSDIFSNFQILTLETNPESVIGSMSNLIMSDSAIYIFDRFDTKAVFKFNNQGDFIFKINNLGKGQDEYLQPSDFYIDNKNSNILIFDWFSKKMLVYSNNDGRYIENFSVPDRFSSFVVSESSYYFYRTVPSEMNKNARMLLQINSNGKIISKHFKYADYGRKRTAIEFSPKGNFSESDNNFKFYMSLCDTVYKLVNKSVYPFLALSSDKYKLSDEDLADMKRNNIDLLQVNKLSGIKNYSENRDVGFLQFDVGFFTYYLLYYFSNEKVICSKRWVDDMTYIYPSLYMAYDNGIVGFIEPFKINILKKSILSGKVQLPDDLHDKILKLTLNSNPLLVFYEF